MTDVHRLLAKLPGWEALGGYVRAEPRPGESVLALDAMLKPAALTALLDCHRGAWRPGACAVAAGSMFGKWLTAALIPAPVALAAAGRALPAPVRLVMAEGLPEALLLPGDAPGATPAVALAGFVAGPLARAMEALARATDASLRLHWSNAAGMVAATLDLLEDAGTAEAAPLRRAVLDAPRLPDGRENPLAGHVVYTPAPPHPRGLRRRTVCCLWDRLEPDRLCAGCPKAVPIG